MEVYKYIPDDYDMICEWAKKRKLSPPNPKSLPQYGAIIPGIACGFLFITDGDFAYIDYYYTNPDEKSGVRWTALQLITEQLIVWAKEMEFSRIMANTQVESIKELAIINGFKNIGHYSVLMRSL
jgi:hypothetical protein